MGLRSELGQLRRRHQELLFGQKTAPGTAPFGFGSRRARLEETANGSTRNYTIGSSESEERDRANLDRARHEETMGWRSELSQQELLFGQKTE